MGSRGASAGADKLSPAQLERKSVSAGIGSLGVAELLYKEKNGREGTLEELNAFITETKSERQYEKINNRANELASRLDRDDYKSAAEREKLIAEYEKLNNQRMAITRDRFYGRNNGGKVIQVLDGKKNVVFEGLFNKYQDYARSGKFKDSYSTRIVRK